MKLKVGEYYITAHMAIVRIVEESSSLGQYKFTSNTRQQFNAEGSCKDASDYRYSLMSHVPKDAVEKLIAITCMKEPEPIRRHSRPSIEAPVALTAQSMAALFVDYGMCETHIEMAPLVRSESCDDLLAWAAPKL